MTKAHSLAKARAPELVIALHCSGGGAGQWRSLGVALGECCEVITPEHYGCGSVGPWRGQHAFTLADEAARTLALIDAADRKVHLVGHSYGGGLALHVALARPKRIASLTLYEPSAFHLLKQFELGANAFDEIRDKAYAIASGVVSGDYRGAAMTFVDYWNGEGAFAALRPAVRDALIGWMQVAPLHFNALFKEPALAADYAVLRAPVLAIRGEHAPAPTRIIAGMMPSLFPMAELEVVDGAGHMGPLTHADPVNSLIVAHICGAAKASVRRAA
jgi:pimeloyl-ACP methyl ester carboxylesterase